jgi:hypothetical protein
MSNDKWRPVEPARALNARERVMLAVLLAEPFRGADALRRQAEMVKVNEECTCGCGSIGLIVDREPDLHAEVRSRIPVEGRAIVPAEDGAPIEVLLHVIDGYLNELEVVPYSEAVHFPDPQQISVWIKDEEHE